MIPILRPMEVGDVETVAALWHRAYWDSHTGLVPEKLARHRDRATFTWRAERAVDHAVIAEIKGQIAGFISWKGAELDQIFLVQSARGTGLASKLLVVGETKIAENGFQEAFLECVVGNKRAAHFYEKSGWRNAGSEYYPAETPEGPVEVHCTRFVKSVSK